MNRTWDENKTAINQLWPVAQFTDEEKRLWHDDLSRLDQDMLYDAIRNVKRTHDSIYPQLKWMLDAYRDLDVLRKTALRLKRPTEPTEKKTEWNINEEEDREKRNEFVEWVDRAQPSEYDAIYSAMFKDVNFLKMYSATCTSIIMYAQERLLGIKPKFGRVNIHGDVTPAFTSQGIQGKTPLALKD